MSTISLKSILYPAIILSLISFTGCEKDKPLPNPVPQDTTGTLELEVLATMNGAPMEAFTIFENVNGQRAIIEEFKFYLGELSLKNASDTEVAIKDVAFFDLLNNKNKLAVKLPEGNYSHLKFYAGVPDALNGTNNPDFTASVYGQDHPLSIFNGMYWTWATGYIFLKVEGKIDTSATQNQTPLRNYFYHVGTQAFYAVKEFPNTNFEIKRGETKKILLRLEYNDLFSNDFETINMATESFTHTTDNISLAQRVFSNFLNGLQLEP
jgi:hypothetical protein